MSVAQKVNITSNQSWPFLWRKYYLYSVLRVRCKWLTLSQIGSYSKGKEDQQSASFKSGTKHH